ncbi:unnamed protein product [Prunus armeniaca]|uniref:Uncharacterized protein n=1 Tax=Prunus armeniaca TaxID=36596 RepID=A0A6J5W5R8_PRUAR|nr:unnamed protein product [Prunus armeniaca]
MRLSIPYSLSHQSLFFLLATWYFHLSLLFLLSLAIYFCCYTLSWLWLTKHLQSAKGKKTLADDCEDPKRQKSYNHILSLLDEEEEEPSQDLSSIITTLQQELSSDSAAEPLTAFPNSDADQEINQSSGSTAATAFEGYASSSSGSSSPSSSNTNSGFMKEGDEQEDDGERVMRHLLEASDDELGIPQREEVSGFDDAEDAGFNGLMMDGFSFGDGLWELEDEAANYYTLVQSELFM